MFLSFTLSLRSRVPASGVSGVVHCVCFDCGRRRGTERGLRAPSGVSGTFTHALLHSQEKSSFSAD